LWRKTHAGERAKARQEALREQRAKNKKEALKEQMKIEQEERERIQSVKEKEKVQTSKEIEKFKEASLVAAKERPQAAKQEEQKSKRVVAEEEEEALPAPRACKTLQVKFTPRVFPTPQRESTQRQENEVGVGLCAGLRRASLTAGLCLSGWRTRRKRSGSCRRPRTPATCPPTRRAWSG
jgi:hypothetical protein